MENLTNSETPVSDPGLSGPGFGSFMIVLIILLALTFVLNILTISALCYIKSVAKLVRVFLINLLVAGLVTALFEACIGLMTITLNFTSAPPPPLDFCRFVTWGFAVGSIARLYSLTAFSVIVLLIVKCRLKTMKNSRILVSLIVPWSVPLLLDIHILIPQIFGVKFYDNVACYPNNLDVNVIKEARYTFTAIWIVFGGLIPLTISIVVPIVVLCYVRRNTMTEGSSYNKGIARFALFLVVGNFINIVGQGVVTLVAYSSKIPAIYLTYAFAVTSLVPTSIFIILFLKPVRSRLAAIVRCKHYQEPSSSIVVPSSPNDCSTLRSIVVTDGSGTLKPLMENGLVEH